jgi:hypothetical protein
MKPRVTAREIGGAIAEWQTAEPSEEFDAGNALVDIIGRMLESEAETYAEVLKARALAEAERSRVKLSLVFPNLPTVFPWEAE